MAINTETTNLNSETYFLFSLRVVGQPSVQLARTFSWLAARRSEVMVDY
jgi:hypothetical protein